MGIRGFEANRRNVVAVITKWFATSENGEEYIQYRVGAGGVGRIDYHAAQGEGDQHFADIHFNDGHMLREFRPVTIEFGKDLRDE